MVLFEVKPCMLQARPSAAQLSQKFTIHQPVSWPAALREGGSLDPVRSASCVTSVCCQRKQMRSTTGGVRKQAGICQDM